MERVRRGHVLEPSRLLVAVMNHRLSILHTLHVRLPLLSNRLLMILPMCLSHPVLLPVLLLVASCLSSS